MTDFFQPVIERLLNLLSRLLSGEAFRVPGAPGSQRITATSTPREASAAPFEIADTATVELALEILGTFNFKGAVHSHLLFATHRADVCLDRLNRLQFE